jgi:hypothetical protein
VDVVSAGSVDAAAFARAAAAPHRDAATVECDLDRSLWAFTVGQGLADTSLAITRHVIARLLVSHHKMLRTEGA